MPRAERVKGRVRRIVVDPDVADCTADEVEANRADYRHGYHVGEQRTIKGYSSTLTRHRQRLFVRKPVADDGVMRRGDRGQPVHLQGCRPCGGRLSRVS